MPLSTYSKYVTYVLLTLSLSACSGLLSSTPVLNSVLAEKGDTRPFETPLPVNTAHKKLALGYTTSVGVKEDGTVWSWGYDTHGSLGNGRESSKQLKPMPINGMTDFIEVAGNGSHFLALRRNGTVWSWGDNQYGQLGYKTDKGFSATPKQIIELKDIVSVAASSGHSLALDKQGAVWGFGSNDSMQLGFATKDNQKHDTPRVLFTNSNATKVISYAGTSALMTTQGEFYYWGADLFLQSHMTMVLPKKYEFPYPVTEVAIGTAIYILTTDGFVWVQSGNNYAGELGQGDFQRRGQVVKVKNIGRVKSITANGLGGIALDEKGRVWQWGSSVHYPFIAGVQSSKEPLPVHIKTFANAIAVQSGFSNSVLLDNGEVYFWGWEKGGGRGTGKVRGHEQSSSKDWSVPEKSLWTWK